MGGEVPRNEGTAKISVGSKGAVPAYDRLNLTPKQQKEILNLHP
jgi:hypothetical protein